MDRSISFVGRFGRGLGRLLADESGQAMVEYSTITMFGTVVGGAAAIAFILPNLLNALNTYLNSVYYILNLPLP